MYLYSQFHQDRKGEKHLQWGAKKKCLNNERGDTSFRSVLDQINSLDQKWISKLLQRHYNPHTVFYSYAKYGNYKGARRWLFPGLNMGHSVVGYITNAASVA